ncbi:alpha/beta hydrolase [Gordonia sp. (in: high G+C Gram-positive bacteria)]|uniref:alpha/beta hydrolase n=1 Tax=Gordonia sp. (in: high G+C Gram-positive bacteria) TaxID=84139 RepID=UPI0016AD051C|nr:alpha/beta hydrolase [Gordonia sp. (in: high G+C Gram-positive bacteria)]NLG47998.1 alpha/beta hydrolase [Gordonia sp. (in: high G+C Gram-positive bacteria)]
MSTRRPDLHPEVEAMLATLEAGFPDVTAFPAAEVRGMIDARRAPLGDEPAMRAVVDVTIDGPDGNALPLRIYTPHAAADRALPTIVFAHGGGFVFCGIDSHDEFARSLAENTASVVVSVEYRLAPEHPAPAALEDMYAAVGWTAQHIGGYGGDPTRLAVAGDSAGGLLSAAVCLAVRDRGGPEIAAQILLYPMIDDDVDTESYRRYGEGYYNSAAAMAWYWDQYAPGERDDPLVMPSKAASLAGLPPAVVVSAELDPPCDSAERYADRLRADGVEVHGHRLDGLFHGVLTFAKFPLTPSARATVWELIGRVLG